MSSTAHPNTFHRAVRLYETFLTGILVDPYIRCAGQHVAHLSRILRLALNTAMVTIIYRYSFVMQAFDTLMEMSWLPSNERIMEANGLGEQEDLSFDFLILHNTKRKT